ncbi:hypothetical protein [Lacrimispora sp. 210928-DFI.3.58]|uniref:hypothetical protein n=1 Tax=Lacrimispora sp. 210928-DFI.3.58 TaxID=2883214 RepID=UPI0015B3B025|nr:hypothetical protein [Lacrimispora sp. 210928-DFI.3.58]
MRGFMKMLLAVAVTPAFLVGCQGQERAETKVLGTEAQVTDESGNAAEPSEKADVFDLDTLVSEAVFFANRGVYTGEECAGEGHVILKTEEDHGKVTAYVLTMYGEYQFQNEEYFVKEAGSGVIPAVMVFSTDTESEDKLISYREPEDGSGYLSSIREMFPQEQWQTCIDPPKEIRNQLRDQERAYAEAYLKELGREAKIAEFADFEHPIITDEGVEVKISNQLVGSKELADYPFWIGSKEKLEDGIRYIYAQELDKEKGRIMFRKTDYGSGNVEEEYVFDAGTGALLSKKDNNTPLTSAPSLKLNDVLSSTWAEFEVQPGDYTWNYVENGEGVGIAACGACPLEAAEGMEHLKLPRYNKLEEISYAVTCIREPDSLTVKEYDRKDVGTIDAKVLSSQVYEDVYLIALKPDRVYELVAEWDESNMEEKGFYGRASYVVVTE